MVARSGIRPKRASGKLPVDLGNPQVSDIRSYRSWDFRRPHFQGVNHLIRQKKTTIRGPLLHVLRLHQPLCNDQLCCLNQGLHLQQPSVSQVTF